MVYISPRVENNEKVLLNASLGQNQFISEWIGEYYLGHGYCEAEHS